MVQRRYYKDKNGVITAIRIFKNKVTGDYEFENYTPKKINRTKLTRAEMWSAICRKYPSLSVFFIEARYRDYSRYRNREELFNILIDLKVHKSRHLTKAQKKKVENELNEKIVDKL